MQCEKKVRSVAKCTQSTLSEPRKLSTKQCAQIICEGIFEMQHEERRSNVLELYELYCGKTCDACDIQESPTPKQNSYLERSTRRQGSDTCEAYELYGEKVRDVVNKVIRANYYFATASASSKDMESVFDIASFPIVIPYNTPARDIVSRLCVITIS